MAIRKIPLATRYPCIRIDDERPLLLWKELVNAGKTQLLRKECRVDFRRKWLSRACIEGELSYPEKS